MWYDLAILVILALAAWRGACKGAIWQLATIAGIVVCFFFAETVSLAISPYLGVEPPLDRWIAIFVLYIVASFAAFGLARLLRGALEQMKFQDFDTHMGLILGLVKGAVFSMIITFFMMTLSEQTRYVAFHSHTGYASALAMKAIEPVMPQELMTIIEDQLPDLSPDAIVKHREENANSKGEGTKGTGSSGGVANTGSTTTPNDSNQSQANHHASPIGTRNPDSVEEYYELLNSIPGIYSDELSQLVLAAWKNTEPRHRDELYEKLQVGVPGVIRRVANEWSNGKPEAAPEVKADMQQLVAMINDIAGVYSDQIHAQELITDEIGFALSGLPTGIVDAVLRDWHSDVLHSSADPEPMTSGSLPLDYRIVHHLGKQNIQLSSLKSELQQRLSDVARR